MSASSSKSLKRCCLIAALCATLSLVPLMIADGGFLTFGYDYLNQQIPFNMAMNGLKLRDLGGWTWNLDLGVSTVQGFGFYCLGSPFFWLSCLVPKAWIPYTLPIIYILKYIVACGTSFCFIRRFVNKPQSAVVGALLYSFSGFQATNLLFYHFHDVVAFFPLLLIGLEKIIEDRNDCLLFTFAVFLNALLNYYFFIIEVVFLLVYYLFRSRNLQVMFRCLLCGILGVGMACILFLPGILYVLGNSRSDVNLSLGSILMSPKAVLFRLKAFLLPGEAMYDESSIYAQQYDSIGIWLPMLGISYSLAYGWKKRDWMTWLMVTLGIAAFVPILSSAFLLFTENNGRWFFAFSLILSLTSARVADDIPEYPVRKVTVLTGIVLMCFYLLLVAKFTIHPWRLLLLFLIAFSGLACAFRGKNLLVLTAIYAVLSTGFTAFVYDSYAGNRQEYLENYAAGISMENENQQYRERIANNEICLPGQTAGIGAFSSTIANSMTEFDDLFDRYSTNDTRYRLEFNGLPELLADAPIGFTVEKTISADELKQYPAEERAEKLLSSAVCERELSGNSAGIPVTDFSRDAHGFQCRFSSLNNELIYFSVPDDPGWTARIDGEKTEILNSGGMMLLFVPAGQHKIEFSYVTPGFVPGIWISILSWLVFIVWSVRFCCLRYSLRERCSGTSFSKRNTALKNTCRSAAWHSSCGCSASDWSAL